ncbi:hypothetical protein [Miltoncostaea oceani]|uniref:hypothetical protein n=1 Tax=Miltoncostaea oceani TaxID=2843216 RepID=UPI001C3DD705|nr:hypothetical protein [Miltoncostaea oceani]
MPRDLDDLIRAAGADLEPDPDVTGRARARVLATRPRPSRRLRRMLQSRRGRTGMLAFGLLLAGGGATATVGVLTDRGGDGPPWRPLPQNCFALDGDTFAPPPLRNAVAVGTGGRPTVVWVAGDGTIASADGQDDGRWGAPQALGDFGADAPGDAVALVGNTRGDMAVAWAADHAIHVTVRPAGGSWSTPRRLSDDGRWVMNVEKPPLAVGPAGEVAVSWSDVAREDVTAAGEGYGISGPVAIRVATGRVDDSWGAPRVLEGFGDPFVSGPPAIAFDAEGVPIVVAPGGVPGVTVAELDPQDGALVDGTKRRLTLPPLSRALARGASFSGPVATTGADGTVVVGWSSNGIVTAAIRSPRGVWGQPARVSRPGAEANDVRFAVGADGRVAAVWSAVARDPAPGRPGRRSRTVSAAVRDAGERWEAPTLLSEEGDVVSAPDVAVATDGRVSVAWALGTNGISGRDSRVLAADRPATGAGWNASVQVSENGLGPLFPTVAELARGQRLIVWSRCDGHRQGTLRAATGDDASTWSAPAGVSGSG